MHLVLHNKFHTSLLAAYTQCLNLFLQWKFHDISRFLSEHSVCWQFGVPNFQMTVRILHSAKEKNLSPFDSKIACLCRSININNNKHVYHQSQLRKTTGNEVKWVECSLIIGTDYRFRLLLDNSVVLWVSRRHSVCWRVGVSINFFLILNLIWVCLRWRQFSPLPSLQFMGLRVIKYWGRDK